MINSVNFNSISNVYANTVQPKCTDNVSLTNSSRNVNFGFNKDFTVAPTYIGGQKQLRTRLNSQEEKIYKNILNNLDKKSRKELESLLKKGVLLNSDSNNHTSVLDNLNKILTTPRAEGLDCKNILKSAIEILDNPFKSTQTFGDIPQEYQGKAVLQELNSNNEIKSSQEAKELIDVKNSGSCPAASIEFSMAQKSPAEFTRFVEGLSSPAVAVEKEISLSNLADNTLDAFWLLNSFEIPYEKKGYDSAVLKFAPDKNALLRAQIQTKYQDGKERSAVDVLMQSTFMNVGSQQTYDSLSDKRKGKFSTQDTGLVEFEKTFTESVVEDKNKITLTNQKIDDSGKLIGYEYDMSTFKRQLVDTLNSGENVIIGYTFADENNNIVGGHEITLVGTHQGKDGKTYFVCNDSDDDYFGAVEYSEDYLLPKIHHATFPKHIVENDVKFEENWKEGLRAYKEMKRNAA